MEFLTIKDKQDLWFQPFATLYNHTFPRNERRSITQLLSKAKKDEVIINAVVKVNTFIGLTIISRSSPFYIFDYLAIDPTQRNKGYGSTIISHLLNQYLHQPLFLEIENPFVSDGETIKQKRYTFYLKNGLTDTHRLVNLYHVDYLLLTNGYTITFNDYVQSYTNAYGVLFTKMLNPTYLGSTI